MSGDEPTTGWEAEAQDAPADASAGRTGSRLDRLATAEADPVDPVVPEQVETTVPVGTTGTPEVTAGTDEHEAPAMTAAPAQEPPASPEPAAARPASGADTWRDLQAQFVDDPAGAVEGAVALVREAVEAHAGPDGSTDTEHLRQVFTRLRDLHARLTV